MSAAAPESGAPLIVGAWQLSQGHHRKGPDRTQALDDFLEVIAYGATTFDCADIYTGVEDVLGEVRRLTLARMGDEVANTLRFHTKFVPDRSMLGQVDRRYVESVVDRSLRRLGVERLDLVQFAWWDYAVPRWVEVAGFLDEQRRAGKIAALGATNFDVPRMRDLARSGIPIKSHQVQYSILDRRPQNGMAAWSVEASAPLLCYGTLAGGFLTDTWVGKPDPAPGGVEAARALASRSLTKYRLVIEEFGGWDAYQTALVLLSHWARERGATTAQAALRWALDRNGVGSVIVGMSRPQSIRECQGALHLRTAPADWTELDALLARAPGPAGDCFDLERDPDGDHAAIMRYDLNRVAGGSGPA